jgi:hypothetical protein
MLSGFEFVSGKTEFYFSTRDNNLLFLSKSRFRLINRTIFTDLRVSQFKIRLNGTVCHILVGICLNLPLTYINNY